MPEGDLKDLFRGVQKVSSSGWLRPLTAEDDAEELAEKYGARWRGAARLHACRAARRSSGTIARAARFLASWAKGEPGQPDGQAAAGRALRLPHTRAIHVQEHSVPENVWAGQ